MTRFDPTQLKPADTHPALLGSLLPPSGVTPLNFSPGPTSLAAEVQAGIKALFDAERMCSMYLSHRSPEFLDILASVVQRCRTAMSIPEQYEILFMHGGGHGQFAAVPLNLCPRGDEKATYLVNGTWSKRALIDASKYCNPVVVSSENQDGTFTNNPSFENLNLESKYVYLCSNETVNGIELHRLPKLDIKAPLVVDASSDFSTKPIDWVGCNVGVLYACASKNIGHPGLTLCVIRRDLLGTPSQLCPGVLCYTTNVREGNLWNTIATFNVEVVNLYLQWLIAQGGVHEMERRSIAKSAMVYDVIDRDKPQCVLRVFKDADKARAMAEEIAANAPLAVLASKRMMRMGLEETFPTHVQHVYLQLLPLFASDDFAEGVKSFLEKRPAAFTGR